MPETSKATLPGRFSPNVFESIYVQQHRTLAFTFLALDISGRLIFIGIIMFLACVPLKPSSAALIGISAFFLGSMWFTQQISIRYRIRAIENFLARSSPTDELQDSFIRAFHTLHDSPMGHLVFRFHRIEPMFWTFMVIFSIYLKQIIR
jgi:hypothetical protein